MVQYILGSRGGHSLDCRQLESKSERFPMARLLRVICGFLEIVPLKRIQGHILQDLLGNIGSIFGLGVVQGFPLRAPVLGPSTFPQGI